MKNNNLWGTKTVRSGGVSIRLTSHNSTDFIVCEEKLIVKPIRSFVISPPHRHFYSWHGGLSSRK